MANINDLPDEVLEFIMSYLPPYKDLEQCSVVCKRWTLVVKNVRRYAKMNLNKGLMDFRLCWKSGPSQDLAKITARFSHSAVIHENSMYVFGGRSTATTTFNDLWCFDLSNRQWLRQLPMGNYPSPKANASMVNYDGSLILFGGFRLPALGSVYQVTKLFDELHVYNIKENCWTVYLPQLRPPASAGHSASLVKNRMIIFGGFQGQGVSNDVWCLDLNTFTWIKQETSRNKPKPRYGQFQFTIDDSNLLILGGCGGPNNIFSDAWLLNLSGEIWEWRAIEVRNKKWAAAQMWCNPAAKVGSKLVVLGTTKSVPNDFQIVKQTVPHPTTNNRNRSNMGGSFHRRLQADDRQVNRDNRTASNSRNIQPNSRLFPQNQNNINPINVNNNNSSSSSTSPRNHDDAAVRLQRNLLHLRNRDDEHLLPRRFLEQPFSDRLGMIAFNIHENFQSAIRERQLERLRRMQDKYHEIRLAYQQQKAAEESSKEKRAKKNCIAILVCDLTNLLTPEPYIDWLEYKNCGIINGAPERVILSTICAGKGELIMFGGIIKETLTSEDVQVSNSVNFLTVPRGVI